MKFGSKNFIDFFVFFVSIILIDIIIFREYLFNNNNIIGIVDAYRQFLPYFLHLSNGIRELSIPLWWQYTGLGYPFVGIIQSGCLYPPNYIFSILPQPLGYNLSIILHLLLLQIAVYIYSNYLTRNNFFSFLSSLSMSLSFFILIHLDIYPLVAASGYYVLVLYSFHKILDNLSQKQKFSTNNIKLLICTSFFLSLEFLTGYPQIFVYNLIHIGLYSLTYIINKKVNIRSIIFIILPIILLTLITISVQLLATRELLENTIRKYYRESIFNDYSYPPYMLLTYIFPYIFGDTPVLEYWGPYDFENTITFGVLNYISIITLPLFMFGTFIILKQKKENFYPLVLSGIISLLLAFGYYTFIHYIMYFVPIYSDMRSHLRNIFQFNLCIAIVSCFALTYLYRLILIKKNTLNLFYKIVISNLLILTSIFISFFLIIEEWKITNIFKSLYYSSSYLFYSFIFLCLYFLCFLILKYSKKYLLLIPLILLADNQFFCSNLKILTYINYPRVRIHNINQNTKYIKKYSNIKENDTLLFNRMINRENRYLNHPITPTNSISIHNKVRILNIYDPFIDMEYFYTFYISDNSFLNYFYLLFFLCNPLILSTYGIDYFIFESDTNENIFQEHIQGLKVVNKKEYEVNTIKFLKDLWTPAEIKVKIEDAKKLYLLIIRINKPKLSLQQRIKKIFLNLEEVIEINVNNSYSIYYPHAEINQELIIVPYVIENRNPEKIIKINSISPFREVRIESLKIFSFPNGILSMNPIPFEIVYQRKHTHFSPIYQVWKNNQSFGKIFSTQKIQIVKDFDEFREKLYSLEVDTSLTAIITEDQLKKIQNYKKINDYNFLPNNPKNIKNLITSKANIDDIKFFEKIDIVEFRIHNDNPSFIVINNRYHDGWKAYLNQKEIPVLKTNGIVQGLIVPPGKHKIKLKFEPSYKKIIFLPLILLLIQITLLVIINKHYNLNMSKNR